MSDAGSTAGIGDWQEITPDRNHDWIARQEAGFEQLYPLGSKAAKAGKSDETVFELYSKGLSTGRDAYLYNFSKDSCLENARLMIEDYRAAIAELGEQPSVAQATASAARHSANIHWDVTLRNNLKQRKEVEHSPHLVRRIPYRSYVKQYCFVADTLAQRPAIRSTVFPTADTQNRVICVPGVGSTKPFSALMVDAMPDIQFMFNGQCFPRYRFESPEAVRTSGWRPVRG